MNRKAQIQILETIAVLAVFFVLVVLGFSLYSKFFGIGIEDEKIEGFDLNAIKISQKASFLPELQCSLGGNIIDNCIDLLKLEAMPGIISREENKLHYFDNFGFSRIMVKEIYPGFREFLVYSNSLDDYSYKAAINIPISLFDPIENKYSFAVMNVEVFSK